jgi:hypothetical protein
LFHSTRALLIAVVSLLAAGVPVAALRAQACDPRAPRVPVRATTRLVDGIPTLEHQAGAFDRAPCYSLHPTPVAVIGGSAGDPKYDLTYAHDVALLSDGRVATLASIGNKLYIFGADGRPQHDFGRQGKGPGEIMAPDGIITLPGDTLFVPDPANARFNWIHPEKGFVVEETIRNADMLITVRPAGVMSGRRLVVHSGGRVRRGVVDSIVRPPTPVNVINLNDGSVREIAKIPDLAIAMFETRYRGERRLSNTVLRFGRRAHIVVWGMFIATGSGDGYVIDVRATGGSLATRIRVDVPRRAVTQRMRDSMIAGEIARLPNSGSEGAADAAERRRVAREKPFADSLPPYGNFFVTPRGILWVVDAIVPGEPSWGATAFRSDGAIVGRLRASGGFPMAFSDDRVVLRSEDQDGVVSLRVHKFAETPP